MSTKSWKRTRRKLKAYREDLDRRKREAMRVPWYIRLLCIILGPKLYDRWVKEWRRRHEEKLRSAFKRTVRFARRIKK